MRCRPLVIHHRARDRAWHRARGRCACASLATNRTNLRLGRSRLAGTAERNWQPVFAIVKSWRTSMSKLILAFALFCAGLSLASAQSGHLGTSQEQQACSRDASRLCRKQLGDDASVQQCLQQNRRKLSSACLKVFQSHGQ